MQILIRREVFQKVSLFYDKELRIKVGDKSYLQNRERI